MIRSVTLLMVCQVAVLSVWFSAAAVLPALAAAQGLSVEALSGLSAATQIGFALGALMLGFSGLPDRFDPRRVFMVAALSAGLGNTALLWLAPDSWAALLSRTFVGLCLAGVYPVGLKIAVGWSQRRRGLITSLLVGALTLGSASPHLVAWLGSRDAEFTLLLTSGLAALGGVGMLAVGLGPFHQISAKFDIAALRMAWQNVGIRRAYLGYFGHMWELYAFWGWVAVMTAAAARQAGEAEAATVGSAVAFIVITLGGLACVPAGWLADRYGKERVARNAMVASAFAGLLAIASFHAPLPLFVLAVALWGITIIPDSAQFSALVADHAPPDKVGSLLTLQTAIGFSISVVTVQALPWLAAQVGWSTAMAVLVMGPAFGVWALRSRRSVRAS